MHDKVTPCIYFDGNAAEAVDFYVSLLKNSRVLQTTHYPAGAPLAEGAVMTIQFELQGRPFMAINGGPEFPFTPAISLVAYCDTQEELDELWDRLGEGGKVMACGWLTDRFGISWQIVPSTLPEMMSGDTERAHRVVKALWNMVKLDFAALHKAADAS